MRHHAQDEAGTKLLQPLLDLVDLSAMPAGQTAARKMTKQHLSCPVLPACPAHGARAVRVSHDQVSSCSPCGARGHRQDLVLCHARLPGAPHVGTSAPGEAFCSQLRQLWIA